MNANAAAQILKSIEESGAEMRACVAKLDRSNDERLAAARAEMLARLGGEDAAQRMNAMAVSDMYASGRHLD